VHHLGASAARAIGSVTQKVGLSDVRTQGVSVEGMRGRQSSLAGYVPTRVGRRSGSDPASGFSCRTVTPRG
jgi:hypothetical protein